jgi:hypothetical protein
MRVLTPSLATINSSPVDVLPQIAKALGESVDVPPGLAEPCCPRRIAIHGLERRLLQIEKLKRQIGGTNAG